MPCGAYRQIEREWRLAMEKFSRSQLSLEASRQELAKIDQIAERLSAHRNGCEKCAGEPSE